MTRTGREALGLALTRMMRGGQITLRRVVELARMVLRENAVKLYGLQRAATSRRPRVSRTSPQYGRLATWAASCGSFNTVFDLSAGTLRRQSAGAFVHPSIITQPPPDPARLRLFVASGTLKVFCPVCCCYCFAPSLRAISTAVFNPS